MDVKLGKRRNREDHYCTMSDPGSWRRIPVRQVVTEISRLNAGQRPCSFADCKVIAARMHWRFRFLPREAEQDAYADELRHVIYLPNTTDEAELVQLAIHELSEILTHKDGGEPEFHYQGGAEEHHQVARLVEAHLAAMSRRIQTFNVVGETPPPPGDLEAPPLDLDYLVLPNA